MIKYYCFFIAVLSLTACVNKRDKSDFKSSFQPCDNNLRIERFTVFGSGAFGGDLLSAYLTDSTNFRMYIGTFDDAQGGYFCECHGDTIVVKEMKTTDSGYRKIAGTRIFSLKELKKQGKFE
ncbi:hypothetical protein SAMN05518672_102251 [Chitinophaga sp. CF118]|uniref:hypothetical protein n=1 Tax=Chitinophaga sp. CF118 TaxID=1884367 RepID=UPI0008E9D47C|nr:hypothetical protein [Chitinophaga sp. CF118]SFD51347.1 hypothetical protein SAMN05518672_102251 [Chitinophaga sp. CF118]